MKNAFFLTNVSIPVSIKEIAYYNVSVEKNVIDYGINNALVEIDLLIEVSFLVVVPFVKEYVNKEVLLPLAIELVNGKVPNVFLEK